MEKKVLTLNEAAEYTGYKRAYLWKLTHLRKIPFSKPLGGRIFFDKEELDSFLLGNPIATSDSLSAQAATYVATH